MKDSKEEEIRILDHSRITKTQASNNQILDFTEHKEISYLKVEHTIIYISFWITIILDYVSTVGVMRLSSPFKWVEHNLLFYKLGSIPFFSVYFLVNVLFFVIVCHHQERWNRGAFVLFFSIIIHGICTINNMMHLMRIVI